MNICLQCNQPTENPKFCSKSCSASYNNHISPKRVKKKHYCKVCNVEVPGRRTLCDEHNPSIIDWTKVTYSEMKGRYKYQKNARIRQLSRAMVTTNSCEKCGYFKHVEVHHIQEISTFSDDTPISTINSPTNIQILCPNCHWEVHNIQSD